jgi:hypothetical protein
MLRFIMVAGSLVFAFVCCASAQDPQTGIPPFSSIQSVGIDNINQQNLNANFSIPIVSSPGRSSNFSFPIVNDSLIWVKGVSAWTPIVDGSGNPTWGWQDALPVGTTKYIFNHITCDSPPPIQTSPHYFNYSYTDPAGTNHKFDVDFYLVATVCGFNTQPRTGVATDGSGYVIM